MGRLRTRPNVVSNALLRGLLAGAFGTGVMTSYQRLFPSGEESGGDEPQSEEERWRRAPAPAQLARRILEGVFHADVRAERIPMLTNAIHWLYGSSLGTAYAAVQATIDANPLARGLLFGAGSWGLSYAQLVPMGIYEPPWRYPARTLAVDLSYHLAYGAGVGLAYERLERLANHRRR